MTRRLLNLLTALSLLLCVAMVALWLRSYKVELGEPFLLRGRQWSWKMHGGRFVVSDSIQWAKEQQRLWLEVDQLRRDLSVLRSVKHRAADPVRQRRLADLDRLIPELAARHEKAGADLTSLKQRAARYAVTVSVPGALPAAALAIPPAWRSATLLRRTRERRRRIRETAHPCPSCGYDLRASPGRCPECGSGREGA